MDLELRKAAQGRTIDTRQWLSLNGPFEGCDEEHGAKRVPLFVGGDSSGGGTTMSLVLTLAKRLGVAGGTPKWAISVGLIGDASSNVR